MYRLIYKSRANQRIDWKLVNDLIAGSEVSNREAGITGVLLATETHFLQVLEGGFYDVNELFMHIVRDPRHEKIQLIAFDCVESRLFGGWAMHGVGIFNFNRKLIDDLTHAELKSQLEEISKMLSGLMKGLQNRKT